MNQQELDIKTEEKTLTNVSDFRFSPIKGQPMLQWRGKRPFTSTSYFPAQEKEQHGIESLPAQLADSENPYPPPRTATHFHRFPLSLHPIFHYGFQAYTAQRQRIPHQIS